MAQDFCTALSCSQDSAPKATANSTSDQLSLALSNRNRLHLQIPPVNSHHLFIFKELLRQTGPDTRAKMLCFFFCFVLFELDTTRLTVSPPFPISVLSKVSQLLLTAFYFIYRQKNGIYLLTLPQIK